MPRSPPMAMTTLRGPTTTGQGGAAPVRLAVLAALRRAPSAGGARQDGASSRVVDVGAGEGQGREVHGAQAHGDGHVVEGVGHGRVGLVDGRLHALDAVVGHRGAGDAVRERLKQRGALALEDGDDLVGELRVGDGPGDVVGGERPVGLDPQGHIRDEALGLLALEVEYAVDGVHFEPAQGDDDGLACHRPSPPYAGPVRAERTARAFRATSWTRTAQTPWRAQAELIRAVCSSASPPIALMKRLREAPMRTG